VRHLLLTLSHVPTVDLDDFFVGIGDINSAFLPKLDPSTTVPVSDAAATAKSDSDDADAPNATDSASAQESPAGETSGGDDGTKDAMLTQNTLELEAQVEERPLAKKQEELRIEEAAESESDAAASAPASADPGQQEVPVALVKPDGEMKVKKEKHVRKALLRNDDFELQRVRVVRMNRCQ
jgi:RNA polymerase II subunit A C-terminal domain phosphatase